MKCIKIDGGFVDVFDVCQAYQQLEADYNVDGWLRERPSNQRRQESISCQLARIGYSSPYRHVDICAMPDDRDDAGDDDVRCIYLSKVMQWGLPADDGMRAAIHRTFVRRVIEQHPQYL